MQLKLAVYYVLKHALQPVSGDVTEGVDQCTREGVKQRVKKTTERAKRPYVYRKPGKVQVQRVYCNGRQLWGREVEGDRYCQLDSVGGQGYRGGGANGDA